MQLKASSAQEAIDRREKIEREMKSKNVEMADMLRERDRALQDLERLKGVCAVSVSVLTFSHIGRNSKGSRGSYACTKTK